MYFKVELSGEVKAMVFLVVTYAVHPKGNQDELEFWTFIGKTDAEAETPIVWPPDVKNWLTGKDPVAEKDWKQKWTTEDKVVGWHHRLNGHESEQALGVGDGQGGPAFCSPWGRKELDITERLKGTGLKSTHEKPFKKSCWE